MCKLACNGIFYAEELRDGKAIRYSTIIQIQVTVNCDLKYEIQVRVVVDLSALLKVSNGQTGLCSATELLYFCYSSLTIHKAS